jgi:hypothetical protein
MQSPDSVSDTTHTDARHSGVAANGRRRFGVHAAGPHTGHSSSGTPQRGGRYAVVAADAAKQSDL